MNCGLLISLFALLVASLVLAQYILFVWYFNSKLASQGTPLLKVSNSSTVSTVPMDPVPLDNVDIVNSDYFSGDFSAFNVLKTGDYLLQYNYRNATNYQNSSNVDTNINLYTATDEPVLFYTDSAVTSPIATDVFTLSAILTLEEGKDMKLITYTSFSGTGVYLFEPGSIDLSIYSANS